MNNRLIIGGGVLVAVVAVLLFVNMTVSENLARQICTMDAKLCSDGSYVSRTGPNCEFAECPTVGILPYESGVKGTISLGPTCPVMRDPPDPACADKPYATAVTIRPLRASSPLARGGSVSTFAF